MSHDIRTPMNAIIGFFDMAEKHIDEPEKVMDCLKKINISSEHLLRLRNDVLDLARITFFDSLKMSQVELKLIRNEIKYTPAGGKITYSVRQTGSVDSYAKYTCSVKDTGIGMSEEFCKCVFNAFEWKNSSVTTGIEGFELGLAITKRFVEEMGGTITYTVNRERDLILSAYTGLRQEHGLIWIWKMRAQIRKRNFTESVTFWWKIMS